MSMQRLPALDGLRAMAILLVVGSHVIGEQIPGGFGVTLFFFISGFIITRVLMEDDALWPFYIRRFLRLAPALFCAVLAYSLIVEFNPNDVAAALLYYANYHDFKSPLDMTWSLAVEEHFYFLYPTLFVLLSVKRLRTVVLCIIVLAPIWRYGVISLEQIQRVHRSTDTRIDSIAWGCGLSLMFAEPRFKRLLDLLATRAAFAIAMVTLLACFLIRNETFRESIRYSLQGLAFVPIFCALFWKDTVRPARRLLESRPLVYIGTISYSLYLFNQLGFFVGLSNPYLAFALVSVPATLASYYLVETPMRRLGSRLASRVALSRA